ncbi:hypothetical protein CIB48_g8464 [Xylaria polymorpha]|nr:hypothetical protein CIB48_g8464 [Xylaria polymorpha]
MVAVLDYAHLASTLQNVITAQILIIDEERRTTEPGALITVTTFDKISITTATIDVTPRPYTTMVKANGGHPIHIFWRRKAKVWSGQFEEKQCTIPEATMAVILE